MKNTFGPKVWIRLLLIASLFSLVEGVQIATEVGQTIVLVCPLTGEYPEWFGPPYGTPLTKDRKVIAEGMAYIHDKDLRIAQVVTSQAGQYHCRSNGTESEVNLVVNSYNYTILFDNARDNIVPYDAEAQVLASPLNRMLALTCTVKNAFPQPHVSIAIPNSDLVIQQSAIHETIKLGHDHTYTVTATVSFNVTLSLNRKNVVCNATSSARSKIKSERLYVIVPPLLRSLIGAGDMSAATDHGQFKCESTNTWPLASVQWSFDGSNNVPDRFVATPNRCKMGQNYLYNCSSTLVVNHITKDDNGKPIICNYIFMGKQIGSQSRSLRFHFPPTSVRIEGNGQLNAQDGKRATVTCSTDSANEASNTSGVSFMWKIGTDVLNTTIISRTDRPGQYHGYIASESVSFPVTKSMHGKKVACLARNVDSPGMSFIEDSRTLNVAYSPVLVMPYNNVIHVYEGDTLTKICSVDSNPVSVLKWVRKGVTINLKDKDTHDNKLMLIINSTKKADAGPFVCTADNGIAPTVGKSINVVVYDKPHSPVLIPEVTGQTSATIKFSTSQIAPPIPRQFYVQFKTSDNDVWTEIEKEILDTEEGEYSRLMEVPLHNLQPGTFYHVRLKSLDLNGLAYYTTPYSFQTKDADPVKSLSAFNTAILATFFVLFTLLVIAVCIILLIRYRVRKGKCETDEYCF